MKILGITGGSGSGKTTLLRAVERLGGLGLDCDAIYHRLLETDAALVAAIGARFPGTVRDGRVDRPALAAVVFADPAELAALDALTHEAVAREVRRRLWQSEAPFAAIDAIGLFESGLAALCDETVCVLAPEETRIERLIRRDGISRERALARIRAQKSDEALRAQCGHALWADAPTPEAFQQQCEQFLKGVLMMEETKKFAKEREALLSSPKNGYDRISEADLAAMESYCKEYMKFISDCKMEREAVKWTIEAAEKAGFRELKPGMQLKPGDRVYGNNHNKSVIFAVVGSESLNEGTHICAAHIDSPRLDLKPNPLYEDAGMAYFKTHYYGGIKKYQWTTTPLAIHGVVAKKDGTVVTVTVGEEPGDPIFCVTDLLVHLSADQMRKTLAEGVTGENLLRILESRLDNVVYRLGFAKSRAEARQQVRHGHITVNGRRVDIPSFRVKPGDLVAVAPKAADLLVIKSALISNERVQVPAWLEVDIEKLQGSVLALPQRDQIDLDIREQLIVELYSK